MQRRHALSARAAPAEFAQAGWPTARPITYVVPFTPGKLGRQMGMEVVAGGPEELAAPMAREIPRWAALVTKSGAKAD